MKISRRKFLELAGTAGVGAALSAAGCRSSQPQGGDAASKMADPTGDQAYMAIARGPDPEAITKAAIDALGGIERFVKDREKRLDQLRAGLM